MILLRLLLLLLLQQLLSSSRASRFQQLHTVCHLLSHQTRHCTVMLAARMLLRTNENNPGTTRIHCLSCIDRYGTIDMILG
uniref:Putative secreted peptide n=1 Tax=Anopheles braziliensis TaxID=58242 RepID=A0A2M3ZT01_9DIPT